MKYLNIILILLLLLCFWAIIAIGLGVNCLLIDVGDLLYTDTVVKVNDVFKNLSYSYFAGFIMYILTVIIPQNKRSKDMKPLVYFSINEYYAVALHAFWCFYTAFKIQGIDISMNKNVIYYTEDMTDKDKRLIANLTNNDDIAFQFKRLAHMKKSYHSFLLSIMSCEVHLNSEQLTILNNIRTNRFYNSIEPYKDFINMSPEVDLKFYKDFDSYISEIVALRKTIEAAQ